MTEKISDERLAELRELQQTRIKGRGAVPEVVDTKRALDELEVLRRWSVVDRTQRAEAKLAKIQDTLSSAPHCDKYADDDVIKCGWKNDMIEVRRILDESGL